MNIILLTKHIVKNGLFVDYKRGIIYKDYQRKQLKKTHCNTRGYLQFSHNKKEISVHTYIHENFYGKPIREGFSIDHIDGNNKNNSILNLAEVTLAQNNRNKFGMDDKGLPNGIKLYKGYYTASIIYNNAPILLTKETEYDRALYARVYAEEYLNFVHDAYFAQKIIPASTLQIQGRKDFSSEILKRLIDRFGFPTYLPVRVRVENLKKVVIQDTIKGTLNIMKFNGHHLGNNEITRSFIAQTEELRQRLNIIHDNFNYGGKVDCPFHKVALSYIRNDPNNIIDLNIDGLHDDFHQMKPDYVRGLKWGEEHRRRNQLLENRCLSLTHALEDDDANRFLNDRFEGFDDDIWNNNNDNTFARDLKIDPKVDILESKIESEKAITMKRAVKKCNIM